MIISLLLMYWKLSSFSAAFDIAIGVMNKWAAYSRRTNEIQAMNEVRLTTIRKIDDLQ